MDVVRSIRALKGVNILKMSTTIVKLLCFRLTWTRHNLDYLPPRLGPKFVSARQAAGISPDGGTTLTIGWLTSIGRASIFYWVLSDAFERERG